MVIERFEGVFGAVALQAAQVEQNLGLPALAVGRPQLGVGGIEHGEPLAIDRLGLLGPARQVQDAALIAQAHGLADPVVDVLGMIGDQPLEDRAGGGEGLVDLGLAERVHGHGQAVEVRPQVAAIAWLVGRNLDHRLIDGLRLAELATAASAFPCLMSASPRLWWDAAR